MIAPMAESFSELIEQSKFEDGVLHAAIPDSWQQGRTTYGGLSAALCLEAAQRAVPDLPALRSVLATFVGPAGGDVEGKARILRQGKSVTQMEADVTGEKGLATRCVFVFGAARPSQINRDFMDPLKVRDPDDCEVFIPEGVGPTFTQHFDTRLVAGARPAQGAGVHDHFIWVRHRDRAADGIVALLALADMPPPAVMGVLDRFAPISTMTWMANLLTDDYTTDDGWYLLRTMAENVADGYSSQEMGVWRFDRTPIATMRQNIAIFY